MTDPTCNWHPAGPRSVPPRPDDRDSDDHCHSDRSPPAAAGYRRSAAGAIGERKVFVTIGTVSGARLRRLPEISLLRHCGSRRDPRRVQQGPGFGMSSVVSCLLIKSAADGLVCGSGTG
jgi:hypothetical protein